MTALSPAQSTPLVNRPMVLPGASDDRDTYAIPPLPCRYRSGRSCNARAAIFGRKRRFGRSGSDGHSRRGGAAPLEGGQPRQAASISSRV
jgi:hypothetical protein